MRRSTIRTSVVCLLALLILFITGRTPATAQQGIEGARELLTPQNSAIVMIDHQHQMTFGVGSMDREELLNNVNGLAKTAKGFGVPTVLTVVTPESFSGPLIPHVRDVFPDIEPIVRTSMNSWENDEFKQAIRNTGRQKIIMAALWTEVCLAFPVLSMLDEGYEIYIVTDASAGIDEQVHEMAIERMIQAGARPVTWMQVMLEYQRDWDNKDTYDIATDIIRENGAVYGLGLDYVGQMLGEGAGEGSAASGSSK